MKHHETHALLPEVWRPSSVLHIHVAEGRNLSHFQKKVKWPGSMTEQRTKHIHWFRTIKYSDWLENIFWKISRYLTACSANQLTILSGIHLTWSQALTGYMAVFRAESIVHEGANKIFQRASHSTPNTFSGIGFIIQMCRTVFISCTVILDTSLH